MRQVDELVANPEPHLFSISVLADGDHQLVLVAVTGVRDDGVDALDLRENVHTDGERVQVHRMTEAGQSIAAGIFLREVENEGEQSARF